MAIQKGSSLKTSSGGSLPYRSYIALLNQSGTDAPVPTIIYNDLGFDPVWEYVSQGTYNLLFTGGFPGGKTFVPTYAQYGVPENWGWNFAMIAGDGITVTSSVGGTIYGAGGSPDDNLLFDFPIEVRVYN